MKTDYMRIGEKVYGLTEINAEGIDIDKELREFYEQRHGALAEEFGKVIDGDVKKEWDTQIAHLRKHAENGVVKVPANMFNKTIMVWNKKLVPMKMIVYAPNVISATKNWIINADCNWKGKSKLKQTGHYDIVVKPSFAIPLAVVYDKDTNTLYTPEFGTYHTMNGKNVCTGNHSAKDYWNLSLPQLEIQMNKVNTFSPARSSVNVRGFEYRIKDLLTDETYISHSARGGDTWTIAH